MRSFEDRKAEIFRRSGTIKKEKQRKTRAAFSAMYALVLMLTIGIAGYAAPIIKPQPSIPISKESSDIDEPKTETETAVIPQTVITVQDRDGTLYKTQNADYAQELLLSAFENYDDLNGVKEFEPYTVSDESVDCSPDDIYTETLPQSSYYIRIISPEGGYQAYILSGNTLCRETDNQSVYITDELKSQLLDALNETDKNKQ